MFMLLRFFKGMVHSEKKIGEMNGRWAALFRIVLVLLFLSIPTLGTWAMWVTRGIWKTENHIKTTEQFSDRLNVLEKQTIILNRVDKSVQNIRTDLKDLPDPIETKKYTEHNTESIKTIKDSVILLDKVNTEQHNQIYKDLGEKVNKIERDNATDHAAMKTTLEFIKEKVNK